MRLTRRAMLALTGATLAGAALTQRVARAQTPKNYGPNHGYDDGGRLMAAWLER
jgi:hypothetical protein